MSIDYMLNPDKYHVAPPRLDGEKDEQYKLRLRAYSMGMQSQQAKIDELQKQVITQGQNFNDQAQKLKDVEYLNKKLQARNDYLSKKFNGLARLILDECEYILKGNKDD